MSRSRSKSVVGKWHGLGVLRWRSHCNLVSLRCIAISPPAASDVLCGGELIRLRVRVRVRVNVRVRVRVGVRVRV